jgi:hypothetical protein
VEHVALTEETVIDQLVIDEHGNVMIRAATRILRDGEVVAATYHRRVLGPLDDASAEPDEVRAIAEVVRTPDRLARAQAAEKAEP